MNSNKTKVSPSSIIIIAIVIISIVIWVGIKISNAHNIEVAKEEGFSYAQTQVENICKKYGLDDSDITFHKDGDVYGTTIYGGKFTIINDNYLTLSSQDALDMMIELNQIEYTYKDLTVKYDDPLIICNEHHFRYEYAYSQAENTKYVYVMMDNEGSVITSKCNQETNYSFIVVWTDTYFFK